MKYYLSSYKLGNETNKLKEFVNQSSTKFGYIPNALDFAKANQERRKAHIENDMNDLRGIGIEPEILDLKDYFEQEEKLREKLNSLGGLYISGGNTFILRQSMKLSGLDNFVLEFSGTSNFIYSGYSAAGCVLSPTLKAYNIVDDATDMPYSQIKEQIWEGLGIFDFVFQPHYDSANHPETKLIDKEIQYCIENKILFKAYKDGEVLIIE